MNYATHYRLRHTSSDVPQSMPLPGQVMNSAGGFTWSVGDWGRLDRFLILGSEGGSYYASERRLTVENAETVQRCIRQDPARVTSRTIEISESGRAPKNDPALFTLAMASAVPDAIRRVRKALPRVARTGSHLLRFLEYAKAFRGWGCGLRRAVGDWYLRQPIERLAYQVVKYRQRGGWSHRDALRLAHPKTDDPTRNALFRWIVRGTLDDDLPQLVLDFARLQQARSTDQVIELLKGNPSLTWEMIPTQFLAEPRVWAELLPRLPMTALLRNLGRMASYGLLDESSPEARLVAQRLTDPQTLKSARIHPVAILGALVVYRSGRGVRGGLNWVPSARVSGALDEAFHLSFGNVRSSGERWLLALDVSDSMSWGTIAGIPGLSPRMASAAMAMVTARVEPNYRIVAFSAPNAWLRDRVLTPLDIRPGQSLDSVVCTISGLSAGGTDCALPMLWALERQVEVDKFVIYTDNETWFGDVHPAVALQRYRQHVNPRAKLVVVGMVSNRFSIADPNDPGMLDVVGFDTAAPDLIASW